MFSPALIVGVSPKLNLRFNAGLSSRLSSEVRQELTAGFDAGVIAGLSVVLSSSLKAALSHPSLGAIDRRLEPRTRRVTDKRAKSLIDGIIHCRAHRAIEPRSHPRSDPPIPGSSAGPRAEPFTTPQDSFAHLGL